MQIKTFSHPLAILVAVSAFTLVLIAAQGIAMLITADRAALGAMTDLAIIPIGLFSTIKLPVAV